MKIFLILSVALALSCKSKPEEAPPVAEEPSPSLELGDGVDVKDDEHEIELGDKMYSISRRFANIWFAGQAGNAALVKYQTHEIEEVVEDLEKAGVREGKILVGKEFTKTIFPHLEAMEEAVEKGSTEEFVKAYETALTSCNSCHVQTGHPFLVIQKPTHDPYTNLRVQP